MEWNNAREYAQFKKEQEKFREEYLAAGMTEEQITAMYEYDLHWLNKRRSEALFTQELDVSAFDDEGDDEAKNPLYKKFLHCFAKEDKHWESERFGWIEDIENKRLYRAVKQLSDEDKELLTKLLFDEYSQTQVAKKEGVHKVVICKKVKRIKNFLKEFLKNG